MYVIFKEDDKRYFQHHYKEGSKESIEDFIDKVLIKHPTYVLHSMTEDCQHEFKFRTSNLCHNDFYWDKDSKMPILMKKFRWGRLL